MDQPALMRALAKAISYKNAGKDTDAAEWAQTLIDLLATEGILPKPEVPELPQETWEILAWDISDALAKTTDDHGADVGMDAIQPALPAFLAAVIANQKNLDAE